MTHRVTRLPLLRAAALLLAVGAPAALRAQGAIGNQGYGYPTGQLSTRTLGTGGGLAEFDPVSPLNPAALSYIRRATLAFQYDPEFRRVTAGGTSQNATIARFPVLAATLPFRDRYSVGISASTYLDRSFVTRYRTTARIGEETVTVDEAVEARGSIADIRFGVGAYVTRWLRAGVAVHALTGENRLFSGRTFPDTTRFGSVGDTSVVDFAGTQLSAGVELTPIRGVSIAGSARRGLGMRVLSGDSTLRRADAPDRIGVGLRVDRVTGATFALSYARNRWTRLRGLGGPNLDVFDGTDLMGGVEAVGPRLGELPLLIRLGARQRTLPFGLNDTEVRERAFTGVFRSSAGARWRTWRSSGRAARRSRARPPTAPGSPTCASAPGR